MLQAVMKVFVTIIGTCWAIFAWLLWPLTSHLDSTAALFCAIWLAPSYLLLSVFRGTAIPMRVFVASAVLILTLVGLRVIPGRYDILWVYLICPPALASVVAAYELLRGGQDLA
jgi:hypothetical protein